MKSYYFWIESSKGTQAIQLTHLSKHLGKSEIEYELEDWCSSFRTWHVSENIVYYGFVSATPSVQKKVLRFHKLKAERAHKVDLLIAKKITTTQYNQWAKKNKKALQFPFKCS